MGTMEFAGLSDMLKVVAANTRSEDIQMIEITQLRESDENFFNVNRIEELAESILGQGGVMENLIVTPLDNGEYEIISGHRRRAAVQYLIDQGENISHKLPCCVKNYEDEQSKLLDLVLMNTTARQLSDAELMQSYETLNNILQEKKALGEKFGKTREKLAEILSVSSAQVGKMQNVEKNAIEPIKEAVKKGDISISTANEIAKLDEETQKELAATADISEVKPKEIKKKASKKTDEKKVDTNINFSETTENDDDSSFSDEPDEKVDTSINFSDKPISSGKREAELLSWAKSLSKEQINYLCDGGWYNSTINGYLIKAAEKAGFSREQITALLDGLKEVLSDNNKDDADDAYYDF